MAVNLKFLYDDIVEALGFGTGNAKFNSAFPRATNRALNQLENRADTGTDFTQVNSINESVTQLDAKHEYILYAGIMFWLQRMGHVVGDTRLASAMLRDSTDTWNEAIGAYTKDKINEDQTTGGIDIIGIGYVGD